MPRPRRRGQAAPLVALMLPVLLLFTLTIVELAERWLEVAMLEDALQQATRSAVQQIDYAALARGAHGLRADSACHSVSAVDPGGCAAIVGVARQYLIANLSGARGLAESPAALADRVRWTVLPAGGACPLRPGVPPVSAATPLLCAEVRPELRGLLGWGSFRPLIVAADTIDPLQRP